jgi:hypothetical protein
MEELNDLKTQNKELKVAARFRITNPKKFVVALLLVLWIAFSVFYIARDLWSDFKVAQINNALNQGYTTAVTQLYEQASNEECNPVKLTNGENEEIQLINVSCLQAAEDSATTTPIQ